MIELTREELNYLKIKRIMEAEDHLVPILKWSKKVNRKGAYYGNYAPPGYILNYDLIPSDKIELPF